MVTLVYRLFGQLNMLIIIMNHLRVRQVHHNFFFGVPVYRKAGLIFFPIESSCRSVAPLLLRVSSIPWVEGPFVLPEICLLLRVIPHTTGRFVTYTNFTY